MSVHCWNSRSGSTNILLFTLFINTAWSGQVKYMGFSLDTAAWLIFHNLPCWQWKYVFLCKIFEMGPCVNSSTNIWRLGLKLLEPAEHLWRYISRDALRIVCSLHEYLALIKWSESMVKASRLNQSFMQKDTHLMLDPRGRRRGPRTLLFDSRFTQLESSSKWGVAIEYWKDQVEGFFIVVIKGSQICYNRLRNML